VGAAELGVGRVLGLRVRGIYVCWELLFCARTGDGVSEYYPVMELDGFFVYVCYWLL
jgi:hypothetical protein